MRIAVSALLSLMIGVGAAYAQAPATTPATPPAAPATPAAAPAAPAKAQLTPDEKKAISKSCSDQATAKGLKGKDRKKFRKACKKNGGTPPS
jgi:hypothetical protein